ncbi:MAG: hypothetical protein IJ419_07300 [Agathobacter sp.]|nr:hypothetical protein [Agathobacter sp.]
MFLYTYEYADEIAMAILGIAALIFVIVILKDMFTSVEWFDILHRKYGYEVNEERWFKNHPEDNKKLSIDDSYLSENNKVIISKRELTPHA